MEVKEFSKYVVDNLGRATVGNALNIINRLSEIAPATFVDFVNEVIKYSETLMSNGTLNKNTCYKIVVLSNKILTKYNSDVKYNKTFIMNDFIIDLWRIINGR